MTKTIKRARGWSPPALVGALLVAGTFAAAGNAGCTGNIESSPVDGGTGAGTPGEGLPCDVAAVLSHSCISCHGSPLSGGAPMPLLTYGDLAAVSAKDSAASVAERCLARMQSASSPMPPSPATLPTASEIAAFEAWINAGLPQGTCDADAGPNPFDDPPVCTSGAHWTLGDEGSPAMFPGRACITCHKKEPFESPSFILAGTVYPSGHEPDSCNGGPPPGSVDKAQVIVVDANQNVITMNVNGAGNFYRKGAAGSLATPYTAKVVYQGKERVMVKSQTDGDCNACHTQNGANGAPGRIALP